jgi:hypothetical protein
LLILLNIVVEVVAHQALLKLQGLCVAGLLNLLHEDQAIFDNFILVHLCSVVFQVLKV